MGFGKIFETMFEGSLVGSGPIVFSVWSYVIAKQRPSRIYGSVVRIQPVVLAATFGGVTPNDIQEAIEFLGAPDPKSSTKKEEGRRLIRVGEFEYQVVNGAKYRAIRDEEERREQNREAQQRFRQKNSDGDGADLPEAFTERPIDPAKVNKRAAAKAGAHTPGGKVGRER